MKNPFKRPKQTIDGRRQARTDLAFKLQAAQDDLSGARHNAVQAALAGAGDAEQAAAEDKIHRAEIHALTLENALLAMDVEIEEAEAAERLAADQAQRKATADDLEDRAVKLEKAAAPLAGVLADISAALDGCLPVCGEIGMPTFISELIKTLPDGFATIVAEVRTRANATRAGSAPATLAKTVPTLVPEPIATIEAISVFALENLTWRTERGQQTLSAFHIEALPFEPAQIALNRGLAVLPDSERAQAIIRNKAGLPHLHDPAKMYDLDRDPGLVAVYRDGRHVRDEPGRPVFEAYDRGPPRPASWVNPHPIEPTLGQADEF